MTRSPMDAAIRRAAGRSVLAPVLDQEQPIGNIGIGRGGSARPVPRAQLDSMEVSARIRRGAMLARQLTVAGGVTLGLDDADPFA